MTDKKHLVFIINPKSGVDRQKAIQHAIDTRLDNGKYSYEIAYTQRAKHGIELAREAASKGAYVVVAVGGDGSVNDVMKGLLRTNTALAIIPKGSGNGVARTFHIPLDVYRAIDLINRDNVANVDIGFANDSPFISNAGTAFDALIAREFAASKRRGLIAYSWLVTKHLWAYREREWSITIDGKEIREKAFMVNVANCRQFGYNFQIAPQADWTDGIFDIVIIKKFPKLLGGGLVWRAMNGTLTGSRYVSHYRGRHVVIRHPDMDAMQVDGDLLQCESTVDFRIECGIQKVLVP
ncbi:MAG: diacylglycerol kinase family lipid kinase [Sphingobacteriales bacterium]|nr:MAG: diacylglycerol kinase family lipid kinase [Sphingobacteriales bacterium]